MKISLIYAGGLALWFTVLSLRVMLSRIGGTAPSLGDGGDPMILRRIRAHANFAEYVPLVLVMMGFLELSGLPAWALHAMGACLLLGRLLHGYAFAFTANSVFGRSGGIVLTLLPLIAGGVLCLWRGLAA